MNLSTPVPVSRIAAVGLLVIIIVLVWGAILSPLISAWERRVDEADRTASLIVRLKQSAAEASGIRDELAKISQAQHDQTAFMVAANPNLAAANLQAEVKRLVESQGAQLRSIQQLAPAEENGVSRIAVRAEVQSDTAQLSHVLYDLESHRPIFSVQTVSVRGSEQQLNISGQQPPLTVEIEVAAFTSPPQ